MVTKRLDYNGDTWRLFRSMGPNHTASFLLDSSRYHEEMSRFSYMGWSPRGILRSRGRLIEYQENGQCHCWEGDPLAALEKVRQENLGRLEGDSEFPFNGGLAGYISYDMGKQIENLDVRCHDDLHMYDQYWGTYDGIVVSDHLNNEMWIVGCDRPTVLALEEKIFAALKAGKNDSSSGLWMGEISSNFSRQDYLEAVLKVKEHIRRGNIYQANLSQRFKFGFQGDTQTYYEKLRQLNPSYFGAFLHFDEFDILSMSPERYLKIQGNYIETRPIKGTRGRGRDAQEDQQLVQELQHSEKDRAELLMIVDLERNDLGRLCLPGSVRTEDLFAATIHPSVIHLDARIHGILPDNTGIDTVLRSTFPGGSITGAPKIMAMNIIEALEPTARGVYTGSIGYLAANGTCDLNIAIRTMIIKDNYGYYQAGGGLVADSDPEAEFEETLVKSKILFQVQEEVENHGNN